MYTNEFEPIQSLFSEVSKQVTESFLSLGLVLVFLPGLIFIFPAIISILFAIFILLTGLFVLVLGYFTWKAKTVRTDNLNSIDYDFNLIKPRHGRPHSYRFQNIRFIRW